MVKKQLDAEGTMRLTAIQERLLMTVDFLESLESSTMQSVREIVIGTGNRGDLRALRLIAREVDAMVMSLAPHERDGLNAILASRLGVDVEAEYEQKRRPVAVALKRGRVASEKERRRLEEYVESLEIAGGDPAEIDAILRLLTLPDSERDT